MGGTLGRLTSSNTQVSDAPVALRVPEHSQRMQLRFPILMALLASGVAGAQEVAARPVPDGVLQQYVRFADIFGSRLVAAFDSIPADLYGYRPTPVQQSIGFIAQHLEDANYALCERMGTHRRPRTAKDSLADSVKAGWPKDTLVARLRASLDFCDVALHDAGPVNNPAITSTLLAFETDLAEHYSQLATYMRILGMVPPSALPPPKRIAIDLPASALTPFAGTYLLAAGVELTVTVGEGNLLIRSNLGGAPAVLWAEGPNDFFVRDADAQVTFQRDVNGGVTGLVLHQFGRDRVAQKVQTR